MFCESSSLEYLTKSIYEQFDDLLQFEEVMGRLPDSNLPLAQQLEQVLQQVWQYVNAIVEAQTTSKLLEQVSNTFNCLTGVCRPYQFKNSSTSVWLVLGFCHYLYPVPSHKPRSCHVLCTEAEKQG